MNGLNATLSAGDGYQDGMASSNSPVLRPMRLRLQLSPSPPLQVTEVSRRPPNPDSTRERSSNRRKIKPSLGDAVLIRFMTNGRDPDIANFEADREFTDPSDQDDPEDDEGHTRPEPEEDHASDTDDEPAGTIADAPPDDQPYAPGPDPIPSRRTAADQLPRPEPACKSLNLASARDMGQPFLYEGIRYRHAEFTPVNRVPPISTPASTLRRNRSPDLAAYDGDYTMEDSDEDQSMASAQERERQPRPPYEAPNEPYKPRDAEAESPASNNSRESQQARDQTDTWQDSEMVMADDAPEDRQDNSDSGARSPGTTQSQPPKSPAAAPQAIDDYEALAAKAVTAMSRQNSNSAVAGNINVNPKSAADRTPLPDSRMSRGVPRLKSAGKREPSPYRPGQSQLLTVASVASPGDAAAAAYTSPSNSGYTPVSVGDAPTVSSTSTSAVPALTPSSIYATSDQPSPSAYSPGTHAMVSPRRSLTFEHPPFHARPPPNLLPAVQMQPNTPIAYSSTPLSSNFNNVTLSPITSEHASGRGPARGSYEHAGPLVGAKTPKTTKLPPIDQYIANSERAENSPDARPLAYSHPSPGHLQLPPIACHASPPQGPASPHTTYHRSNMGSPVSSHHGGGSQYYMSSAASSTYGGGGGSSRRATFDLAADASTGPADQPPSTLPPPMQQHMRHPLPSQPPPPMPASLARPAMNAASANNSRGIDVHKRGQPIYPKPVPAPQHLALHLEPAPGEGAGQSRDQGHAQGPLKPRQHQPGAPSAPSSAGQGTYKCTVPGCTAQPFVTQYLLNSHANVHSEERPHYCPEDGCPRSKKGNGFKRKNEMIRHGLVHKSPGYVCPFCPDREHKYPRPDNLLRHVRAHHKDKSKDDADLRNVLAQRPDGPSRGRRRRN